MKESTDNIYYPATRRFPKRAARWQRISYRRLELEKNKYTVTVKHILPPPFLRLGNIKITFISDLHYTGSSKCRNILSEIISTLKAEKCDILLLGGDICANSSNLHLLPEVLERLAECTPKSFAVLGNWERGKTWLPLSFWEKMYKKSGIELLINQKISFGDISITGVDDCGKGYPELSENFTQDSCNILLAHRPDTVVYLDAKKTHLKDCHLALCGHTHAGQIRFIRGLLPASKYGWTLDYGFFNHQYHNTKMYVTSGTGELSFPFRINSAREIVIFTNAGFDSKQQ